MNKKRTVILCAIALVTGAFAYGAPRRTAIKSALFGNGTATKASTQPAPQTTAVVPAVPQSQDSSGQNTADAQAEAVPDEVIYALLFREVRAFNEKAKAEEQLGNDAAWLRTFHRRQAGLTEEQAGELDRIADKNERSVAKIDEKARKIIDAARARYKNGKLKEDESLPEPPEVLKKLQKQRDSIVLQARDELRTVFGEPEFKRFNDFARKDITSKIKTIKRAEAPGQKKKAAKS